MKSEFEILISFRTPDGFKACRQYFLGSDRVFAEEVFKGLAGKDAVVDNSVIHIDLVETSEHIPEKVKTIAVSLTSRATIVVISPGSCFGRMPLS